MFLSLVGSSRLNGVFAACFGKGEHEQRGCEGVSCKKRDFGDIHDGSEFKNLRADADKMYEQHMQKQQALMQRDRGAAVKVGKLANSRGAFHPNTFGFPSRHGIL